MKRITILGLSGLLALGAGMAQAQPAPAPEQALTRWTFVAIDGKAPVSPKSELAIFRNRISATVGCNHLAGGLEVVPGRLKVSRLASTQMYCEKLAAQESAVAELLNASPAFFIEGNRMAIRSAQHSAELVKKRED